MDRAEIQAWIDNRFGVPNTVNIKVYEDFYEFIVSKFATYQPKMMPRKEGDMRPVDKNGFFR